MRNAILGLNLKLTIILSIASRIKEMVVWMVRHIFSKVKCFKIYIKPSDLM